MGEIVRLEQIHLDAGAFLLTKAGEAQVIHTILLAVENHAVRIAYELLADEGAMLVDELRQRGDPGHFGEILERAAVVEGTIFVERRTLRVHIAPLLFLLPESGLQAGGHIDIETLLLTEVGNIPGEYIPLGELGITGGQVHHVNGVLTLTVS